MRNVAAWAGVYARMRERWGIIVVVSTTARQIRPKLHRARENIEEFHARATAFYAKNPHLVDTHEDAERGQRVYYLASVPKVPDALAAIAADALGNLRKPLDYIATAIEYRACGVKPKHRVYFPVGRDATHYESVRGACIKCAGQTAIDAFDAAEPYKGGAGELLWQLHELNKPDKHDLPLTVSSAYGGFDMGPIMRDSFRANFPDIDARIIPSVFLPVKKRICPLKVGDKLFAEPLDTKFEETRKFGIAVSFHEPGVIECEPVVKALTDFANAVDGIVEAFEPLLP